MNKRGYDRFKVILILTSAILCIALLTFGVIKDALDDGVVLGFNISTPTNYSLTTACSDSFDNDLDGWFDSADPGCLSLGVYDSSLNSEFFTGPTQCSDEIDNEDPEDSLIDGYDPQCLDWRGYNEEFQGDFLFAACNDTIDNDGDNLIDWPNDSGCSSAFDNDELDVLTAISICNDGLDNDNDGKCDFDGSPGTLGCSGADLQCSNESDASEASDWSLLPGRIVYVREYGAVGNGVQDDSPSVLAAVAASFPGDTITFDAGKTYRLRKGIRTSKPLNIEGNGATLLLDTSNHPDNEVIEFNSWIDSSGATVPPIITWREQVSQGDDTFNVAVPLSSLKRGDIIYLQLGNDPYDYLQEHFATIARVLDNTGSQVRIDRKVPYPIVQGNRDHKITKINLVHDIKIRNINFDHVEGTVPDNQVLLHACENIVVENLGGRFTDLVTVAESRDIKIKGLSGEGVKVNNNPAQGRPFGGWQSDRVLVEDVNVLIAYNNPVFFMESWARDTIMRNLRVEWTYPSTSDQAVFIFTGNSSGNYVDNVEIDNRGGGVSFIDHGGAGRGDYSFGSVKLIGQMTHVRLTNIVGDFTYNGITYPPMVERNIDIPLTSELSGAYFPLAWGVIKEITVRLNDNTGIDYIAINNQEILPRLASSLNEDVHIGEYEAVGSMNFVNSPPNFEKNLVVSTGTVNPGTTLSIKMKYYPF